MVIQEKILEKYVDGSNFIHWIVRINSFGWTIVQIRNKTKIFSNEIFFIQINQMKLNIVKPL